MNSRKIFYTDDPKWKDKLNNLICKSKEQFHTTPCITINKEVYEKLIDDIKWEKWQVQSVKVKMPTYKGANIIYDSDIDYIAFDVSGVAETTVLMLCLEDMVQFINYASEFLNEKLSEEDHTTFMHSFRDFLCSQVVDKTDEQRKEEMKSWFHRKEC